MIKYFTVLFIFLTPLWVYAEEEHKLEFVLEAKSDNPHWRKEACLACHTAEPNFQKNEFKFDGDILSLCNDCHISISSEKAVHAVGMVPSKKVKARIPANYPLSSEGSIDCLTCHELPYQCLKKEYYRRKSNPYFLKGAPFKDDTEICNNCHLNKLIDFKKLNPHEQINDEGEYLPDKCLYCHKTQPDPKTDDSINSVTFVVNELKELCQRCHKDRPHPGGKWINFDHLIPPPPKNRMYMLETEKRKGIVLPLEPRTGKIFCCTCHNPHERGVLRGLKNDRGADNKNRLRLLGGFELCGGCHADKISPSDRSGSDSWGPQLDR